jgi:hypothetical protein
MENYKKEIIDITEKLIPSTPLEFKEKRDHEATVHINNIVQEAKAVQELYDITTHIWTSL